MYADVSILKIDLGTFIISAIAGAGVAYLFSSNSNNTIFQFATQTETYPWPSTKDPNIIRGVMQRDLQQEALSRIGREPVVPREVAEGDMTMEEYLASQRPEPTFTGKSTQESYKRYCHEVIYPEGEPVCVYDISEESPEERGRIKEERWRLLGLRPLHHISDDDPRWPAINELRRRQAQNTEQRNLYEQCYDNWKMAQYTGNGYWYSAWGAEREKCPRLSSPTMTKEQYLQMYYRPLSTAEFDKVQREIEIEEHGGYENWLYNKQRLKEIENAAGQNYANKRQQNKAKYSACQKAFDAQWKSPDKETTLPGAPKNDCYKLLQEGMGKEGLLPGYKEAKARVLGTTTPSSGATRFGTTLGAYGGRITKRRDYI